MGLDLVEYIIHVEERFQRELPVGALEQMRTVGDLATYLHQTADSDSTWTEDSIFATLKDILVSDYDIHPDAVTPNARFVDDLGLD